VSYLLEHLHRISQLHPFITDVKSAFSMHADRQQLTMLSGRLIWYHEEAGLGISGPSGIMSSAKLRVCRDSRFSAAGAAVAHALMPLGLTLPADEDVICCHSMTVNGHSGMPPADVAGNNHVLRWPVEVKDCMGPGLVPYVPFSFLNPLPVYY
jgi:hypothetical protein